MLHNIRNQRTIVVKIVYICKATLKPKVYGQKENNQRDFAGLPLLRPAEGKRVDWMSAQGNDGYNPYGYDPEEYDIRKQHRTKAFPSWNSSATSAPMW